MVRVVNAPDKKSAPSDRGASGDARHQELLLQFTKLESRADKVVCMVGVNIALTLVVLGKLFLAP